MKIDNKENLDNTFDQIIVKLGNIEHLEYTSDHDEDSVNFSVKSNLYSIPVKGNINVEEEIAKLTKEIEYYKGFLVSVEKKLANSRFVDNAPVQVVAKEKQKQADALAKIRTLEESLGKLVH